MFSVDGSALCAVVFLGIFLFMFLRRKRLWVYEKPFLYCSSFLGFRGKERSLRESLLPFPRIFEACSLLAFLIAFIDPHFLIREDPIGRNPMSNLNQEKRKNIKIPTEGIAIYLVLDQSSSMKKELCVEFPDGRVLRRSRMEHLKRFTRDFIAGDDMLGIRGRSNDMIGLIAFARAAHVLSPLTLDHRHILECLSRFETVDSQEEDGTAIGYALFKAVNLVVAARYFCHDLLSEGKPAYEIKNTILILVTDGLQGVNVLDQDHRYRAMEVPDAAHYAREKGVRLYIVNIEPQILQERFSMEREELQYATEITGGRFYVTDRKKSLQDIYREIDLLEKSVLPGGKEASVSAEESVPGKDPKEMWRRFSLYPHFIVLGMFCLFAALILDNAFLRRVP